MSLDTEATDTPITVKTAARFLGVSPSLVYATVERKQIPHYRMMAARSASGCRNWSSGISNFM